MHFKSRYHAGELLVKALENVQGDVVVALPSGGVPVASEVSKALNLPLEFLSVRKMGLPKNQEYAFGVLSTHDVVVLNEDAVKSFNLNHDLIKEIHSQNKKELEQNEEKFRKILPKQALKDKTVILIDDGIATGTTIHAAIEALKKQQVREVIIAVPVAPTDVIEKFKKLGHQVVCLHPEKHLKAVGFWYEDFSQVSEDEVLELLEKSKKRH